MTNYNELFDKFSLKIDKENNLLKNNTNKHKEMIIQLTEMKNLFSSNYTNVIMDLTFLIEKIQSVDIDKKENTDLEEESPASIIRRKPHEFQELNTLQMSYLEVDDSRRIVNNKLGGWCTVKILGGFLEEGKEDSLELMIHNEGSSSDSSGFMIGLINLKGDHNVTNSSGQTHFSFSRGGTFYDQGSMVKEKNSTLGQFGSNTKVKFTVNPDSGEFSIHINDEGKCTGVFHEFKEPMCFALGLYYVPQKVELLS